jgi:hypothetical protein
MTPQEAEEFKELRDRMLVIEHTFAHFKEEVKNSLNQGNTKFSWIENMLRPSIAKVASWVCAFVITMGVPIAVTVFRLGKYPDAESFVSARAEYTAMQKTLDERVKTLEVSKAEQEVRLRSILESLNRLESKLDSALSSPRRR